MSVLYRFCFILLGICIISNYSNAQNRATLYGVVTDSSSKEFLFANIFLQGTKYAVAADLDGKYEFKDIPAGTYNMEVRFAGYGDKLYTGIKLKAGDNKKFDVQLVSSAHTTGEVTVVGEKPLVDVGKSGSSQSIDREKLQAQPARQVQDILNSQPGIVNSPTGLHIRGSRTYETGFYIDDVSAKDPLAGTGFGVDIGSNAISDIDVSTSGAGVEYGNNTGGVINTKTASGGSRWSGNATYKRDNFGFNKSWNSVFNHEVAEVNIGGPITKKFKVFVSLRDNLSDTYIKNPPKKLVSSLYPEETFFTPLADNKWSGVLKLNYDIKSNMNLAASYIKSLTINQDVNNLRFFGNDAAYQPGYQFAFRDMPDNATTYTNDLNMQALTFNHFVNSKFSYKVIGSRLFIHQRADANGRPWRPSEVNTEFDPRSIVTFPSTAYNPNDTITFVNPASGLYNNGGISTLWHDHIVEEYTMQFRGSLFSKNQNNKLSFGTEYKHQFLQWIDITRPWIGAPISMANGQSTQTFRLGDISDIWKVKPTTGAFYLSDNVKYLGLNAEIGGRLEYWAPGKFVDDAVENPRAPIANVIRDEYKKNTINVFGNRVKTRFLPRISASFPIKENQVMYFNYRHSMVLPHPSYVYAGLDPYYQDRSTISSIGNPNLNPEVEIAYELGLKSQLTANDALNIAAFWKDKYDFITSSSIDIPDASGRDVNRTMRINSDYARIRGIEVGYMKRIKKWFNGQVSVVYSSSTGQSASASETLKDILATGNREDTREYYLPWDVPVDFKFNTIFTKNDDKGLFGIKKLNKMRLYFEGTMRSGRRYTPYVFKGNEPVSGRPIYEINNDPTARYSKLGPAWLYFDANYTKWWYLGKDKTGTDGRVVHSRTRLSWFLEVTNLLNSKNTLIVNPVTGRAYEYGDPVTDSQKDPKYNDPRDPRSNQLPPDNPARFLQQRHFLTGIGISF